jgi:hypothetical protein
MLFSNLARLLLVSLVAVPSVCAAPSQKLVKRASRTTPPAGAIVVRASGATSGQFTTIQVCSVLDSRRVNRFTDILSYQAAVNSLPNDSSSRTIFIYPGTYNEVVKISRSGPLTVRILNDPAKPTKELNSQIFGLDLRFHHRHVLLHFELRNHPSIQLSSCDRKRCHQRYSPSRQSKFQAV